MTGLASQPHEAGWVRHLAATDEQLDLLMARSTATHPLDHLPAHRLRAYQRVVLARTPLRAARARHGTRRRPVPRWMARR